VNSRRVIISPILYSRCRRAACKALTLAAIAYAFNVGNIFADEKSGPWNLPELKQTPKAEFGPANGLVRPVYYAGEPLQGKPTRVFAWYARPAGAGPFPAVVLVHGGQGKAFRDWALHWADRGYAALAMDLNGQGPEGPLPDGGPDQSDETKFRQFENSGVRDMWSYHAVAAVIRGHSLLAAQLGVDPNRIGITGISWGGYLTCIVAGLDDRLKAAVPVYGCGFLADNSAWTETWFRPRPAKQHERWVRNFDPSQYLPNVRCPILFLNSTTDFAYPLDSYRKSYRLVNQHLRTIALIPRLQHGHIWTFPEVDQFMDSKLRDSQTLPQLGPLQTDAGKAKTTVRSTTEIKEAALHYTLDQGAWQKREWKAIPAVLAGESVSVAIPEGVTAYYLAVRDARGLTVSTEYDQIVDPSSGGR
jgi:dienelactone hydrolase